MPTFASSQVSVTSQTLRTTLTLQEILSRLAARAPDALTRRRGWRAITADLQRPTPDVVPSSLPPEIWPADSRKGFPERLAARYVWWTQRTTASAETPADDDPWMLDGIDVIISHTAGDYRLLWSSQDRTLVAAEGSRRIGDAVEALQNALLGGDPDVAITAASHLTFSREIYLWLTRAQDSRQILDGQTRVLEVAGMSTDEHSGRVRQRSSVLSGEVDLARISFISAIATGVLLGPAEVTFTQPDVQGKAETTRARLFTDGAFKVLLGGCHYRGEVAGLAERLEAVQRIAFRYLPLVQTAFASDTEWLDSTRDRLLVEKQVFLSQEFLRLARANPQYAAWVEDTPQ